jgi:hypothetical protein
LQTLEEVDFPLKINYRVGVKILLPAYVSKKISETVRRFDDHGLWRVTLSQIFMVGYLCVERCGGVENFVEQIYEKKKKEAKKEGMGESHDK